MAIEGFTPFPEDKARLYREKGYWEDLTLGDILDRAARTVPNKEAAWDQRVRVTYAQLKTYADRLAPGLLEMGIGPKVPSLKYILVAGDSVPQGMVAMKDLLDRPREKERSPDYLLRHHPHPDDVATILTTGGTTAMPKGVPRTHNDYIANSVWSGRMGSRSAGT